MGVQGAETVLEIRPHLNYAEAQKYDATADTLEHMCAQLPPVGPMTRTDALDAGAARKEAYEEAGVDPRNLSRCLEDGGTITSPLIPWNTCGATMLGALKVGPHLFAPFAFFNLLCPLVSVVLGFTGWGMRRAGNAGERRD